MSIERGMDKEVVYIYTIKYYSAIKKRTISLFLQNNTICSNMNGPRDFHTEQEELEKDKYHMLSLISAI